MRGDLAQTEEEILPPDLKTRLSTVLSQASALLPFAPADEREATLIAITHFVRSAAREKQKRGREEREEREEQSASSLGLKTKRKASGPSVDEIRHIAYILWHEGFSSDAIVNWREAEARLRFVHCKTCKTCKT